MKYKTQGDYEAYLADQAIARRERAEQLRSQPRVVTQDTAGYLVDLYAFHPGGKTGPQLPEPWCWYAHLDAWWCQVTRNRVNHIVAEAKRIFEIEE